MVRRYHPLVAELAAEQGIDAALSEKVAAVSPRVFELSEFLVDVLGVTDVGARFPHTVAFHPTCHSTRLLGVGDRPTRLLAAVEGLTLVDLPRSEACCGFGGTFAVKNADTSVAMGLDKVDDVLGSGAEVLTAGDTSCLMHIGGLLSRRRSPVRVMHLAEILADDREHGGREGGRVTKPPNRRRAASARSRPSPVRRPSPRQRRRPLQTSSSERTSAGRPPRSGRNAPRSSPSGPTGKPSGWREPRSRTRSSATCPRCWTSSSAA